MLATEEELELIRDSILLPMMLDIAEKNRAELENYFTLSLKALFLASIERLQDIIHADLVQVKKQLREKDIKVWELNNEGMGFALSYRYRRRGYENSFDIMKSLIKSELSMKLGKYISRTMNSVK